MTDPAAMGPAILDALYHQLSIDDPWTVRDGDTLTWWPGGGVRQHVRAEGPVAVADVDTWWLTIETPVWRIRIAPVVHAP